MKERHDVIMMMTTMMTECGREQESELSKARFKIYEKLSFSTALIRWYKSKHSFVCVCTGSGAGWRVRIGGRGGCVEDSYQFNSATKRLYHKNFAFLPCITKIVIVGPNSSFARQR